METNIHNVITINWKEVVKCHGRKFVKISNKREAARTTEGLRGCWNRTKKEMFPNDTDNATLQANFIEKFNLPTGPTNKTTHPKTPEKKLGSDAPLTKQDGMVFQQHVDKKFLGIERLLTAQKRQQSVVSIVNEKLTYSKINNTYYILFI